MPCNFGRTSRLAAHVRKQDPLAPVIRGDNVGALTLVLKMRPETAKLAIIARGMVLCLVICSFLPSVYHTPGVAHVIADAFSRIDDPSKPEAKSISQHPALAASVRAVMPVRSRAYYKALLPVKPASHKG